MLCGLIWCFILYFIFFQQVIGPSEGEIYELMYIFTFLRRILRRKYTRKLKIKNGAKNRYQVNFFRKKFGNLLIRPYTFILQVFVLFLLPEKKPKFIVHPLTVKEYTVKYCMAEPLMSSPITKAWHLKLYPFNAFCVGESFWTNLI